MLEFKFSHPKTDTGDLQNMYLDLPALGAIAQSVTQALSLARAALEIKNDTERKIWANQLVGELTDLTGKLLASQVASLACQDRVNSLEAEIKQLREFELDKQDYELSQGAAQSWMYQLKQHHAEGAERHYLCVHCYQQGIKSILQYAKHVPVGLELACSACRNTAYLTLPGTSFVSSGIKRNRYREG